MISRERWEIIEQKIQEKPKKERSCCTCLFVFISRSVENNNPLIHHLLDLLDVNLCFPKFFLSESIKYLDEYGQICSPLINSWAWERDFLKVMYFHLRNFLVPRQNIIQFEKYINKQRTLNHVVLFIFLQNCLKAMGKTFHPECFVCAYCGKIFANSPFYLEDGLPYCEEGNQWHCRTSNDIDETISVFVFQIGTNSSRQNVFLADSQSKLAIAGWKPLTTIITVNASTAL